MLCPFPFRRFLSYSVAFSLVKITSTWDCFKRLRLTRPTKRFLYSSPGSSVLPSMSGKDSQTIVLQVVRILGYNSIVEKRSTLLCIHLKTFLFVAKAPTVILISFSQVRKSIHAVGFETRSYLMEFRLIRFGRPPNRVEDFYTSNLVMMG